MQKVISFILLLSIIGCKDPYELPVKPSDKESLVVEGFLNSGQGNTTISLSRVASLADRAVFKPEAGAQMWVEGKNGGNYPLTDAGNGHYTVAQLPLTTGKEYRLRIKTKNGKEYQSDYVVAKQTPPIDSISWKQEDGGIQLYITSHDPSGNTKYYRWDYEETWEIHSTFYANYKWVSGTTIVPMPPGESTYRCWKHLNSSSILIGTSAQLQADLIAEAPLLFIPRSSEKLGVRYSMLVKQYALTKEAYEFFQLMKKNTESLGTIFDPQPSELRGNIHCLSDPQELVIGYVTASSVEEKRIFITRSEAGGTFRMSCESISILNHPDSIKAWVPGFFPYEAEFDLGRLTRYLISNQSCVDCTKRGGLLTRPSFW